MHKFISIDLKQSNLNMI